MRIKRYTRRKRKSRTSKRKMFSGGNHTERRLILKIPHKYGLGNQLFKIAAGIKLQKFTKLPLYIIVDQSKYHSNSDYTELYTMPDIKIYTITPELGDNLYNKAIPLLDLSDKTFKRNSISPEVALWFDSDIKFDPTGLSDIKIPDILYQNYRAIQREIPDVKRLLLHNEFENEKKKSIYDPIRNETNSEKSAFMHVRLGDYVKAGWAKKIEFYLDALREIDKNDTISVIYVICQEEKWYTDNESKLKECTKKELKYYNNSNELVVLYKMILCTAGAIIPSSTFSLWGAMMGADLNVKSTIVYPKMWISKFNWGENPLMFPARWTKINSEEIDGEKGWVPP